MTWFFIFMVLGNVVVFYLFQKHTIGEVTRQEVELFHKNSEIERLTRITEMNDSYNETIHNMTYSLKVIEQLAIENNADNIREIVEELIGKLTKKEIYEYSNHKMLNTILFEYAMRAEKEKLEFDIYVEPGCILEQIKDIDLASMLGNILDNAFEAASKVEGSSSVIFRMFMHEKGKICIIKVINDYKQKIVERDGKIQTTKNKEGVHGIGLVSISKIANKSNGSFSYYTDGKKFSAVLILPIQ